MPLSARKVAKCDIVRQHAKTLFLVLPDESVAVFFSAFGRAFSPCKTPPFSPQCVTNRAVLCNREGLAASIGKPPAPCTQTQLRAGATVVSNVSSAAATPKPRSRRHVLPAILFHEGSEGGHAALYGLAGNAVAHAHPAANAEAVRGNEQKLVSLRAV